MDVGGGSRPNSEGQADAARWRNWLDRKLPKRKQLGARGRHEALPLLSRCPIREAPSSIRQHGGAGVGISDPHRHALRRDARRAVGTSSTSTPPLWSIPKERMKKPTKPSASHLV